MNFPLIINLIGSVLIIISIFMLPGIFISDYYGEPDMKALAISAASTLAAGLVMYYATIKSKRDSIRHREVFCMVTLCWLLVSLFGCMPYMISGAIPNFTDAYFEAVAGFTTTGATVLSDIEALPHGVLFWRSLTQWLGGMGIILFALAILPFLSSGGVQLFKAEAPELTVDKLRPRIIDTAKALWYIYAALTLACAGLLYFAGMGVFDAVCHAFTTMATGGFSTKNASVGYFQSSLIDTICTAFMFLAGINYTLYFYGVKGGLGRFWHSSEFRFYVTVTAIGIFLITAYEYGFYGNLVDSSRYAGFQVVSIMTTTGFATADYERWSQFSQMLLIVLMFFGGMIGSTGGGMKQVRILLMLKQGHREIYRLIHPHAVTSLKLDGKDISKELLGSIWGFLFLFLLICVVSTLLLTAFGVDILTASTTVVSAVSNVGPALGQAGPTENYLALPAAAKWVLSFCMLAGRLEIYTMVIMLVPQFWKK